MKKIFLILTLTTAFAMAAITANAQSRMRATIPASPLGLVTGTDSAFANGATAGYLYVKPSVIAEHCVFQANVTRKTAAMNGSIALQASVDGINYFATAAADTMHVDNGATDVDKIIVPITVGKLYPYYRLKAVNTATTDTFYFRGFYFGQQ